MAVLMQTENPGMTVEQFNAAFAPLLERIKTFPGFVINASGPTPTGYLVTEGLGVAGSPRALGARGHRANHAWDGHRKHTSRPLPNAQPVFHALAMLACR